MFVFVVVVVVVFKNAFIKCTHKRLVSKPACLITLYACKIHLLLIAKYCNLCAWIAQLDSYPLGNLKSIIFLLSSLYEGAAMLVLLVTFLLCLYRCLMS